jgi:c-di-AMP phosphodiesterase-like protein
MKDFRERFSVTKLVLLLIILALIFIEVWNVIKWWEIDQLFSNVVIAIVSFYFWQKGIQYDEVDSIVEKSDLDDNNII